MMNFIKKKLKEEKGLTLIELLAVIVILGIIAAIAIPAIGNVIENSRYNAVKADALNALSAANIYFAENPTASSVTIADLKTGYLDNAGRIDDGTPATDAITKNGGTLSITTTAIDFSGGKTVTFSSATVESINADQQQGSQIGEGGHTIDATP